MFEGDLVGDPSSDLQGIGGVNAEEDAEDFGLLGSCPDAVETVAIFFVAKTAFEAGGAFAGDLPGECFSMVLKLARSSLSFEVCHDPLQPAPAAIFVGRIDGICSQETNVSKELACLSNSFLQARTFVEGVEIKVFDEVDSICLKLMHLGPKFNQLGFLAPNDGPQIGFGKTDNATFGILPLVKLCKLLIISALDQLTLAKIGRRKS